jgi:hypothetical protein
MSGRLTTGGFRTRIKDSRHSSELTPKTLFDQKQHCMASIAGRSGVENQAGNAG